MSGSSTPMSHQYLLGFCIPGNIFRRATTCSNKAMGLFRRFHFFNFVVRVGFSGEKHSPSSDEVQYRISYRMSYRIVLMYSNIKLSMYCIERVSPSIPWHPRAIYTWYADTEGKTPCIKYRNRIDCVFFLSTSHTSNSILVRC